MQSNYTSPDPKQFIDSCHQKGREAANTGDRTSDPARVNLATTKSIPAEIDDLRKGPLDLTKPEDALLVENKEETKERLRRSDTAREQARRKAVAAQEAVPAAEPPPQAPSIVILAAILALALTFAMSLGELPLLADIDDPILRLLAAGGMGAAIALVSIASLFNLSPYDQNASVVRPKATKEFWSLIASLAMVTAFGLIRMSLTGDDLVLTGGLVACDFAILLYAKASAAQFRNKQSVHAERNDARIQLLKAASDAKQEFEAAEKALAEAEAAHSESMTRFEHRLKLDFNRDIVCNAAIAAWMTGYAEGLDANRNPQSASHTTFTSGGRRAAA